MSKSRLRAGKSRAQATQLGGGKAGVWTQVSLTSVSGLFSPSLSNYLVGLTVRSPARDSRQDPTPALWLPIGHAGRRPVRSRTHLLEACTARAAWCLCGFCPLTLSSVATSLAQAWPSLPPLFAKSPWSHEKSRPDPWDIRRWSTLPAPVARDHRLAP